MITSTDRGKKKYIERESNSFSWLKKKNPSAGRALRPSRGAESRAPSPPLLPTPGWPILRSKGVYPVVSSARILATPLPWTLSPTRSTSLWSSSKSATNVPSASCGLHPETGCRHRFHHHCVLFPRELSAVSLCPVDKEVIKSQEVFKDNYCTREVLRLYAFCKTRLPDVMPRLFWGDTRTPFSPARSGLVQCSKEKCPEPVLSKGLQEHLSIYCRFPGGKCLIAKRMWQSSVYRIMRKTCVLGTQYLVPTSVCRLFQELRWMNPWPCVLKLNETVLLRAVDVLQRINGGTCRTAFSLTGPQASGLI